MSDNSTKQTGFFSVVHRHKCGGARTGRIKTSHGGCDTPCFLPIASDGTLRALSFQQATECGTRMVMANAWYIFRKAGPEALLRAGGAHGYMGWDGSLFTDSGGYQVFSLRDNSKISEEGVSFGSDTLTPERVIEMQAYVGADIMSVLDDCAPHPCSEQRIEAAVRRTTLWARGCKAAHKKIGRCYDYKQELYGIIQGGTDKALRTRSVEEVAALGFGGYGIGGLSIGMPRAAIRDMTALTCEQLPSDKPRHLLGVGLPGQILEGIEDGADSFDCVLPIRKGQRGIAYTRQGEVRYKLPQPAELRDLPLDCTCECRTCQGYSREGLRLLFKADKPFAGQLAACHNIHFFHKVMEEARESIRNDCFAAYKDGFLQKWDAGETALPSKQKMKSRQEARSLKPRGMKPNRPKADKRGVKKKHRLAIAHIKATNNNTMVTMTDLQGNVLCWASAGSCGFSGSRRSTVFAGRCVATKMAEEAIGRGVKEIEIRTKGGGDGLQGAISGLNSVGLAVKQAQQE